jgi:hypothetical protein
VGDAPIFFYLSKGVGALPHEPQRQLDTEATNITNAGRRQVNLPAIAVSLRLAGC